MATQPLAIVQGVVRSARDLSTIRDGKRQTFGVAVELLTEVPVPDGSLAGGFVEVTLFIRDGELLPDHAVGTFVTWVLAVEAEVYRNRPQLRAQFVSEFSAVSADIPASIRDAAAAPKPADSKATAA